MKKAKKEDLRKRLMAYSAAAAGVLAIAPQANAAIQYSGPQNINLNAGNTSYGLDLDGDSTTDFNFGVNTAGSVATYVWMSAITSSNGIINSDFYYYDPARLPSNYLIDSTLENTKYDWDMGSGEDTLVSTNTTSTSGMFNNQRGYIGVRFNTACGQTFGWIQFEGTANPGVSAVGRIIDWAYEDACQPIRAGAIGAAATIQPVPTVGEWGALAMAGLLGGAAVNHLRRRKKEKK